MYIYDVFIVPFLSLQLCMEKSSMSFLQKLLFCVPQKKIKSIEVWNDMGLFNDKMFIFGLTTIIGTKNSFFFFYLKQFEPHRTWRNRLATYAVHMRQSPLSLHRQV